MRPIWLEIFRTIGLLGLRTIGLYCHGTVDIETILNTNQRSGVCTTILFLGSQRLHTMDSSRMYILQSQHSHMGLLRFFFSCIFHSKKNRNKPLWSQNRGVNNITIHILTTSTIVSLLFLSDQLVAIFCMTSKYNPWRAPGFTSGFFGEVRVVHLFSFLCCAIMCLWVPCCYVLCNFRIKTIFGSSLPQALVARGVFASSCLWSCLIYVVCACLRVVMFDTCCVVFFFVLCARGCQFICIVHFWSPLRYSLTFIYCTKENLRNLK